MARKKGEGKVLWSEMEAWNRYAKIEARERRRVARRELLMSMLRAWSVRHGIDMKSLTSPARFRHIVQARIDFMIDAYGEGFSSFEIGDVLNHDHTTVLYWVNADMRRRKREGYAERRDRLRPGYDGYELLAATGG